MNAHRREVEALNAAARCLADLALRMDGEPLPTVGDADQLATQAVTLIGEIRSAALLGGRNEPQLLELADASALAMLLCISSFEVPRDSTLSVGQCETLHEHVMRTLELIKFTIDACATA